MNVLLKAIGAFCTGVFTYVLVAALIFAASWLITCGIIALVCLCFGWAFNWGIATGVWLVCMFVKWIFDRGSK